ncbi:putative mitochondrial protein [Vitis vinifera]|uniref:Putative mitochondrial protein n=1 Tax=Vitis vinifera TaxID=29760 RepID=A0A438JPU7_VITVI|nr:putative mitochondrial protein [Vitis vinifera]
MSAQMAAMVATPNVVTDNSWYPDSSATNHCTANPNNLIIRDTYIGNDQIHMGDSIGLAIQHIVYVDDILVTRSSKVEIQALVQQLNTRFALKDLGEDDHFLGIQDWASNPNDRRSTIDFCLYLGSNLISWNSKKQNIISRSNTEAEYRNLATLAAEVTWIQFLLTELQIPQGHVPVLCRSCLAFSSVKQPGAYRDLEVFVSRSCSDLLCATGFGVLVSGQCSRDRGPAEERSPPVGGGGSAMRIAGGGTGPDSDGPEGDEIGGHRHGLSRATR